jgi:hypothetical protein
LVTGGIAVAAGVTHALAFQPGNRNSQPGIGLVMIEMIAATIAFFFLIDYINYNKKKLRKTLGEYHSGKRLPDWLQKISSWKKFLAAYTNK